MDSDIIFEFDGYCRLAPETRFQCIPGDDNLPQFITAEQWLGLPKELRGFYILEDALAAMRDSEHLEFADFRFYEDSNQL